LLQAVTLKAFNAAAVQQRFISQSKHCPKDFCGFVTANLQMFFFVLIQPRALFSGNLYKGIAC